VGSSPSSPASLIQFKNMKNPFTSIRAFFAEMIVELKKASWPTYTELRDSTIVVLLATVLLGSFIALADFSLLNGVDALTNFVR
tara:strand:+ start:153 stop:404 length:252 start_codon:yes stop_codon:yes gene_type:complete